MSGSTWNLGKAVKGTANIAQGEPQFFSTSVVPNKDVSGISCPLACISFLSIIEVVEGKDPVWLTLCVLCLV